MQPSHGHTQPLGDDSNLQRRTMPQPLGGQHNSHIEDNDAPSHGYAQQWAPSQVDSTQS
jgi:hypothetical protein